MAKVDDILKDETSVADNGAVPSKPLGKVITGKDGKDKKKSITKIKKVDSILDV